MAQGRQRPKKVHEEVSWQEETILLLGVTLAEMHPQV